MIIHAADFNAEIKDIIIASEGNVATPYFDSRIIAQANATIGYGFNIELRDYLRIALYELDILSGMSAETIEATLNQYSAEIAAVKQEPLPTGVAPNSTAAKAYLDGLLTHRLDALTQSVTGGSVARFNTEPTDADAIFNDILNGATIVGRTVKGKIELLDTVLGNTIFTTVLPHDSREYEALMSLFYASEELVKSGSRLATAVINGKRADAWYEIRYRSDKSGRDTGRRITESNLFGLYDRPELGVPEAEAKDVLRMYTANRTTIQDYEARHPQDFPSGGTTSIQFQLIAAETPLINTYSQGRTIDGEVLVGIDNVFAPEHLSGAAQGDLIFGELGLDRLRGNEGDDVLYGGVGNDELTGGMGNDYLDGGQGSDSYVFLTGDGQDTIRDADGLGQLRYDGTVLVGGIRAPGDPAGTFLSTDAAHTFTYFYPVAGGDLVITRTGQPNDRLTLPSFQPGQLGIDLLDFGDAPSGTPPVIDYNNGQPTVTYVGDETDNTPTFTAAANHIAHGNGGNDILSLEGSSAAFNHQLFGGSGHDELRGGAGHDRLFGETGRDLMLGLEGDDVLDGGDEIDLLKGGIGRDTLDGGLGNDGVDGGSGDDILLGGMGDDLISGESIALGDTTTGNDYLDGGARIDWLMGLLGDDVLVGGTEADRLYGDQAPAEAPNFELAYPGIVTPQPGLAFSSAAGGADYLDGGQGNDYLQGDGGEDVLLGGDQDDTLYGDDNTVGVLQEGADFLDGGTGNDTLYGGGGADTLLGGDDDDTLFGDFTNDPVGANDWLDGGAGIDTLVGARGDDVLQEEKVSGTFFLTARGPRARIRRDGTSVAGRRGRRDLSCAQPGEWPPAAV